VSAPISAGGESCLTVNFYFAVWQTACFSSISAYMFNGDRLAFVKAYQVTGTPAELPLPAPPPHSPKP
jgi:hypothetical protein